MDLAAWDPWSRNARLIEGVVGAHVRVDGVGPACAGGDTVEANARPIRQHQLLVGIRVFVSDHEDVIGIGGADAEGARVAVGVLVRTAEGKRNGIRQSQVGLLVNELAGRQTHGVTS